MAKVRILWEVDKCIHIQSHTFCLYTDIGTFQFAHMICFISYSIYDIDYMIKYRAKLWCNKAFELRESEIPAETHFCGGSIISDTIGISAAHCKMRVGTVDAVAGAHNIMADEPEQQTVAVQDFIRKSFSYTRWKKLMVLWLDFLGKLIKVIQRTRPLHWQMTSQFGIHS